MFGLVCSGYVHSSEDKNGCPEDRPLAAPGCSVEDTFMKPVTCCVATQINVDYGTIGGHGGNSMAVDPRILEQKMKEVKVDSGSKVEVTK